jgi:hypothetical protein
MQHEIFEAMAELALLIQSATHSGWSFEYKPGDRRLSIWPSFIAKKGNITFVSNSIEDLEFLERRLYDYDARDPTN